MSENVDSASKKEEIYVVDILRAVWSVKFQVVAAVAFVTLSYWCLLLISGIAKTPVHTYSQAVNFVFDGVELGEYPNETEFSLGDIVSPAVLDKVYRRNELANYMTRSEFFGAFSVSPYAPDSALIVAKYEGLLNSTSFSAAEIEELQSQLSQELNQASRASALLTFSSSKLAKMNADHVRKIINDVFVEWGLVAVEKLGVRRFDVEVYSKSVLNKQLFNDMDYLISFEMLLDKLKLLKDNLKILKALPNGLLVHDNESGLSVMDLERAVIDIERYRVSPLITPMKSLGIAKDPEIVKLYFQNELLELRRTKTLLESRSENVTKVLDAYIGQDSVSANSASGSTRSSVSPQLSSDFLQSLVAMSNTGLDVEFRQELNKMKLQYLEDLADAESELERISEILKAMEGENSATNELRLAYTKKANEEMPDIISDLENFFDVSWRLYKQISMDQLGYGSALYVLQDGGAKAQVSGTVLSERSLQRYLLIVVLSILISVPLAIGWKLIQGRPLT